MSKVEITRNGRIAQVRFDTGTPANALSFEVIAALTNAARQFEEDHETSVIILSGRSDNFALGFDLKDPVLQNLQTKPLAERRRILQAGRRMCAAWENIEALTISAIEGWCVGGGVALAVATDLRVISDSGQMYVPEIERGLNMSWGSVPRITNLTGPARAKQIIVLAKVLSANLALDWGLVDEVAGEGDAVKFAHELAERAADMPPVALRMCNQAIKAYSNALAEVASHADYDQFALAFDSADAREGIAALFEKRDPRFTGS